MNLTKSGEWNEIVKKCDYSKIYHLYEWGTLLEEIHGYRLVYLQEDKGIFPLAYVKSLFLGRRLISLPFADYGGPCARDEETTEKLVSECEEMAQELDVDFIEIRGPSSRYFETFNKHGFIRRDHYLTFVLRLDKKIEELWMGIGKNRRRAIRKAERSGIRIIEATKKPDLKAFYLLYQKTMKKVGSPPQPYKFFEGMWDLFYPQNLMIFLATREGKYIAGKLFFLHKDVIHQSYGCSLREYLQFAPNDLLQWHIIKWGNEHGFKYDNFGRTRENEGTVLFKKQWSDELVKMPYFYKFYKKELNERQEIRYKWVSNLWSKYMPEFIANRIGPGIIRQVE